MNTEARKPEIKKVLPISPDQITGIKRANIPNIVFTVINEMIAEKWDGSRARIYQDAIVSEIMARTTLTRKVIFDHHYLDIEEIYEEAGWEVKYDKPCRDENFEAYFAFSKRKK